jgi:hypothetical protein
MLRTRSLSALTLLAISLAGTARADLVPLSFSGGNGNPLVVNIPQPISYLVTNDTASLQVLFVFEDVGNVLGGSFVVNGNVNYTRNGGDSRAIDRLAGGSPSGAIAAEDFVFFTIGAVPGADLNQLIVLSSGAVQTTANLNSAPPASGLFNTFITDNDGNVLGNGVPEPTSLSLLALGSLALLRRRK